MNKPVLFLCLAVLAGAQAVAAGLSEAELGKALFFDTAFSLRRTMSCATCHDPANAFTDRRGLVPDRMVSLGDDGHSTGNRNAPTAAYANTSPMFHFDRKLQEYVGGQFLDGRAASLADQAMGPPLNPLEMGLPDAAELVRRLRENPVYVEAFQRLYGKRVFDAPSDPKATLPAFAAFGKALQAFEKTDAFSSYDSKYDRYLKGEYQLTPLEELGRTLFFSNNNVNCTTCHALNREDSAREPFTNHRFRNIGVPSNPAMIALGKLKPDYIDHGLLENPAIRDARYDGKFKTPTLRNVAVTGPYMHNGVFRELRTTIEFYDHFNNPERRLNPETGQPWAAAEVPATVDEKELRAPALSDRKIDALVAFLRILTDRRYEALLETGDKALTAR